MWKMIVIPTLFLVGCGIFVQPPATDVAGVATYNNQVFQIVMASLGLLTTVAGFIGLWIKSNADKQELARKTDETAKELALAAAVRSERLLAEVTHTKEINVTALNAANNQNEKMLELHKQVAENTRRAPARATDKGAATIAMPLEHVQKVEITGGAGVETPLKVKDAKE